MQEFAATVQLGHLLEGEKQSFDHCFLWVAEGFLGEGESPIKISEIK